MNSVNAEKEKVRKNRGGKNKVVVSAPDFEVPNGRRLKEIVPVDGSFPILIGGTSNSSSYGTKSETILNREFAFITPGNEFKQSAIHPEPDVWRWSKPDEWLRRCKVNNQIMRLHGPISPQCSTWCREDDRTGEELLLNMEEFLTELCQRYNGDPLIRWMDVVNETVSRDGTWFGPRPGSEKWENPWPGIGFDESHPLKLPLYIKRAFEICNEHAPEIKLVYNQHGGMETEMWRKVTGTIQYLRDQGLRVDGIGWQAHVDTGFEKDAEQMKNLHSLISWAHSHNLEFHVTENTVWMPKERPDAYDEHADTFAAIVKALIEHADEGVVSWNAWKMRDSDSERAHLKGCMFHEDGSPKPAYYAVQRVLEEAAQKK